MPMRIDDPKNKLFEINRIIVHEHIAHNRELQPVVTAREGAEFCDAVARFAHRKSARVFAGPVKKTPDQSSRCQILQKQKFHLEGIQGVPATLIERPQIGSR